MEHVIPLLLPPLLPPVLPDVPHVLLAELVHPFPGYHTYPVLMHPHIARNAVLNIQLVDHAIDPVDLLLLVGVVIGFGPVVNELGELGGIEQGADRDSIDTVVLIRQLADILAKILESVKDIVPAMVLYKIIITSNNEDVHGLCMVGIV